MTNLPAITGWLWVKEGFRLFIKRPGKLTILFVSYTFFLLLIGMIPFLGQIIPPLLTPTFSMVIMIACAQIDQHSEFNPLQLRKSFDSCIIKRLLGLGALYVFLAFVAIGVSWLIFGGSLSSFMTVDANSLSGKPSGQWWGLALISLLGLLYIPLFWFAAPLIVWRQASVGKSIFYSFFAVLRNIKAFIVYFLSWLLVGAILPSMFSVLLSSLIGMPQLALAMLFLLSIILSIVMYCSCYSSYKNIFGAPELPLATVS